MTDDQLNEIARSAFERYCGREYPWEGVQPWVLAAMRDCLAVAQLEPDHKGIRVDYRGLLGQSRRALARASLGGEAELLRQLEDHLTELGQRWYAGDTAAVDEILQLYCIEKDARAALSREVVRFIKQTDF